MANKKVPMTVSTVTPETASNVLETAKRLNVSLYRFPTNIVPTIAQIQHCANINKQKEANGETRMSLVYGSDGQSWISPERSASRAKAVASMQNVRFAPADLADDIAGVISWLGGSGNAKQGTAMRAIDNSSDGTFIDEKSGIVTVTLQNGQKFTVTVAEVVSAKAAPVSASVASTEKPSKK